MMQTRYIFSQFYTDPDTRRLLPVCNAYGGNWHCATFPSITDGWALVQMQCDPHQIEAAAQDPRVLVLPLIFDPSALPQQVTDAYASMGATSGMSLGSLLAKLAETEPVFGHTL
jgi:hypothetical protein